MNILFHRSSRDGLLDSSQCSALADTTTMNNTVLASFLTNASLSVGWIPRSEMALAYLKTKIDAWQVGLSQGEFHGSADPEGNGASVFHNVRI